jgi:hypothetical protein
MTLEQLGQVKAASASKEPERVWNPSAAVYVLTSNEFQRSGEDSSVRGIESGDS